MKYKFPPIPELQSWAGVRGNGLLLANALGVKPPTVSDWVTGKKRIPLDKCMPIERVTEGAVTRRNLRPDDYLIHWPELAQTHIEPVQAAIKTVVHEEAASKSTGAETVTDQLLAAAAQAGLIERRSTIRRADDRAMREVLNAGKVG